MQTMPYVLVLAYINKFKPHNCMNTQKTFNTILTSPNKHLKMTLALDICINIREYDLLTLLKFIYKLVMKDNELAKRIFQSLVTNNIVRYKIQNYKNIYKLRKIVLGSTGKEYRNEKIDFKSQKREITKAVNIDERFVTVDFINEKDLDADEKGARQVDIGERNVVTVSDFFEFIYSDMLSSEWVRREGAFKIINCFFETDPEDNKYYKVVIDDDESYKKGDEGTTEKERSSNKMGTDTVRNNPVTPIIRDTNRCEKSNIDADYAKEKGVIYQGSGTASKTNSMLQEGKVKNKESINTSNRKTTETSKEKQTIKKELSTTSKLSETKCSKAKVTKQIVRTSEKTKNDNLDRELKDCEKATQNIEYAIDYTWEVPEDILTTILQVVYSDKLTDFVSDQISFPVRQQAIKLLKNLYTSENYIYIRNVLMTFLNCDDWQVQVGALLAAQNLSIKIERSLLTGLLSSEIDDVRFFALECMKNHVIDDPFVEDVCWELIEDVNESTIGKKSVFMLLKKIYSHKHISHEKHTALESRGISNLAGNNINSKEQPSIDFCEFNADNTHAVSQINEDDHPACEEPIMTSKLVPYFRSCISDIRLSVLDFVFSVSNKLDDLQLLIRLLVENILLDDNEDVIQNSIELLEKVILYIDKKTLSIIIAIITDLKTYYNKDLFITKADELVFNDSGSRLVGSNEILKGKVRVLKIIWLLLTNRQYCNIDGCFPSNGLISFILCSMISVSSSKIIIPENDEYFVSMFPSTYHKEIQHCLQNKISSKLPVVNNFLQDIARMKVFYLGEDTAKFYTQETHYHFIDFISSIIHVQVDKQIVYALYNVLIDHKLNVSQESKPLSVKGLGKMGIHDIGDVYIEEEQTHVDLFFKYYKPDEEFKIFVKENKYRLVFFGCTIDHFLELKEYEYVFFEAINFIYDNAKKNEDKKIEIHNMCSLSIVKRFIREKEKYTRYIIDRLIKDLEPYLLYHIIEDIDFSYYFLFMKNLLVSMNQHNNIYATKVFSHIVPYLGMKKIRLDSTHTDEILMAMHDIYNFYSHDNIQLIDVQNLKLRPYQEHGIKWMSFLCYYGINGILADDMGLGKTIMVLSFLVNEINKIVKDQRHVNQKEDSDDQEEKEVNEFVRKANQSKKMYNIPENKNISNLAPDRKGMDINGNKQFIHNNLLLTNGETFCKPTDDPKTSLITEDANHQNIKSEGNINFMDEKQFITPVLDNSSEQVEKHNLMHINKKYFSDRNIGIYMIGKNIHMKNLGKKGQIAQNTYDLADIDSDLCKSLSILIITPISLTTHWKDEITSKYKNHLKASLYTKKEPKFDLVTITSFETYRSDFENLSARTYFYVIIDEGHILRNRDTILYKRILDLKAKHKLILTGTPIHNSVDDIFSLFNFLMPNYLGTEKEFSKKYALLLKKIDHGKKPTTSDFDKMSNLLNNLKSLVTPFCLRRLKKDVLKDLPPKILNDIVVELDDEDTTIYNAFECDDGDYSKGFAKVGDLLKICSHKAYTKAIKAKYGYQNNENRDKKEYNHINNVVGNSTARRSKLELRKEHYQGNSVKRVKGLEGEIPDQNISSKVKALLDIIDQCGGVEISHKILVFFQYRQTIDYVLDDLNMLCPFIKCLRLDGTTKNRSKIVNDFQTLDYNLLLITTSVGGLGLNLTSADVVVFYEHDWNPFNDLQAMDRAHRIGQKNTVNVYRLVCKNTIEERKMNVQAFKVFVAERIIDEKCEEKGMDVIEKFVK